MIANPIIVDVDVGFPEPIPMSVSVNGTTIGMDMAMAINAIYHGNLEYMTATPSDATQVILCDPGYDGIKQITIEPIPSNYGKIGWDGSVLTVS